VDRCVARAVHLLDPPGQVVGVAHRGRQAQQLDPRRRVSANKLSTQMGA